MKDALWRGVLASCLIGAVGCTVDAEDGERQTTADPQSEQTGNVSLDIPTQPGSSKPGAVPSAPNPTGVVPNPTNPVKPAAPPPPPAVPAPTLLASLAPATDCSDLLTRIQNDAISKLKMQVELTKKNPPTRSGGGILVPGLGGPSFADGGAAPPPAAAPGAGPVGGAPSAPARDEGARAPVAPPLSASMTNKQVADVDEADFVKVVESGKGIFLLHGNTLRRLKSWPAAETALVGKPLTIEGTPSEMFVTDAGKAVIFSSVWGYGSTPPSGPAFDARPCGPEFCGGWGGGAGSLKITVADVSGADAKVERELFYEGAYLSSRRYAVGASDIVRAVVQANSKFSGLYQPQIQWTDPWGRLYDDANVASQLDEWEKRTSASIRNTKLSDWLPTAREVRAGKLVDLEPDCDSYFVPQPGLAGYGLTHVLSLDVSDGAKPVGGVTIMGSASTVYSNAQTLVLAQPDFRSLAMDFGIINEQRTALHQFDLSGATTKYLASGWVFGQLPIHNPQFGIDVTKEGTIRVATSGWVRKTPSAKPNEPAFWTRTTENYVTTARAQGGSIDVLAKSAKLGHEDETVQSARFIGSRAYVVTFRQTDPLIVVDVSNPTSLPVLGEIEIPGFSQYIHPLDDTHLITFGQGAQRNLQLQLFDVTDPKKIAVTSTLAFGPNSYSEASNNHKAFTFFEGVMAVPLSNAWYGGSRSQYLSGLELVRTDVKAGLTHLGFVDHSRLYGANGAGVSCGFCDASGCFDYGCKYAPEVRRGHFVRGESATYVYSFSHAGVLVHDLTNLNRSLASVGLPAPSFDMNAPWYAPKPMSGVDPTRPNTGAASPPPAVAPPITLP